MRLPPIIATRLTSPTNMLVTPEWLGLCGGNIDHANSAG